MGAGRRTPGSRPEGENRGKKYGRKRWKISARVPVAVAAVLAALLVFAFRIRIRTVTVEGLTHYTQEEFEELLFAEDSGRNTIGFLWREHTEGNVQIPFVDRYTVSLTGLRSVHIVVYEKEIIGYVEVLGGSCLYFDRDGYVVESSMSSDAGVPKVEGLSMEYAVLGEKLPVEDDTVFSEVLNITQYLSQTSIDWNGTQTGLTDLVETIRFDSDGNATCCVGEIEVYLGSYQDMEEKLLEMTGILPELYGREGTLYLDSYDASVENPTYIFK